MEIDGLSGTYEGEVNAKREAHGEGCLTASLCERSHYENWGRQDTAGGEFIYIGTFWANKMDGFCK